MLNRNKEKKALIQKPNEERKQLSLPEKQKPHSSKEVGYLDSTESDNDIDYAINNFPEEVVAAFMKGREAEQERSKQDTINSNKTKENQASSESLTEASSMSDSTESSEPIADFLDRVNAEIAEEYHPKNVSYRDKITQQRANPNPNRKCSIM